MIGVKPDTSQFNAEIQKATRSRSATVKATADTAGAEAKLNTTARDRRSRIHVGVDQAALNRVVAAFANMSSAGARATVSVGSLAKGLAIVGAVAAFAAPAVGVISTALLGIPGAVAVAGAAIGAIALGMDGIKRAAEVAKPALDALKASVSATFEQGMTPVFQRIADVLLPGITNGMNAIAGSLTFLAARFIDVVTSAAGMGMVNTILSNTAIFLGSLGPMIEGFTNGFLRLASVGTQALIGFSVILNNFGLQFDAMTQRLAESGTLKAAFDQLGISVGILMGFFLRLIEAGAGLMERLGPSFNEFLRVLTDGIIAILPLLEWFAWTFFAIATPILNVLLPALGFLAPVLGPLAAVIFFVGSALLIVAGIMWIMNSAVVTLAWSLIRLGVAWFIGLGPIGWIILAVAALVGAFIWMWNTFDWFRNFWIGAWHAMSAVVMWVWHNIIKPTWDAVWSTLVWMWTNILSPIFGLIGWAWGALWGSVKWFWDVIGKPVWDAISAAALWLWNVALKPVFDWIANHWTMIMGVIAWAWNWIGKPIFILMAIVIGVAAAIVIGIFALILLAFVGIVAGIRWAWNNILRPTWDFIAAAAVWLWNNVLMPVFRFIGDAWHALCAGIQWVWNNVLRPAWDAVSAAAQWLWNNVLMPTFRFIGDAWRALVDGIRWVWENILRPAWDAVQNAARWLWENVLRPVFDAIGAAWRGLMDGIRWVVDHILSPAFNACRDAVNMVGDAFHSAVEWIGRQWDRIKRMTADPINFVIDAVYNKGIVPAWGKIAGWLGLPGLQTAAPIAFATGGRVPGAGNRDSVPAMLMPGEYVISKKVVSQWGMDNIHAAHQAARAGNGAEAFAKGGPAQHFANGGPVNGHTWGILADMAPSFGGRVTSAYNDRIGHSGYHGKGQAVDLVGNFVAIAEAIYRKFPNATQIISAQWRGGKGILNGRDHVYAQDNADHWDHVHWAMTPEALGGATGGGGGMFDIVGLVVDWFRNTLMKPVMDTAGKILPDFGDMPYNKAPAAIPGKALDAGTEWIKGKAWDIWGHISHLFANLFGGDGGGAVTHARPVEQWRGLVIEALKYMRLPLSWADVTLRQIASESSGDPNITQGVTDVNSGGNEAVGLLQIIPTTFAANRDPRLPNNRRDPFANIVASMRYAMSRYGSLPAAYRGVGYAQGGPVMPNLYDTGGILPPTPGGYGLYANHTGKPEAVFTRDQLKAITGGSQTNSSVINGDLVVQAPNGASAEQYMSTAWHEVRHYGRTRGRR